MSQYIIENIEKIARNQRMEKYSIDKVKEVYDDEQIIKILCEIGVPRLVAPMLNFVLNENGGFDKLSKYGEWAIGINTLGFNAEKAIVLADYNNCLIYIDLSNNKIINMIDYDNRKIRYVNENIECFLESVICFNLYIIDIMKKNPEYDYIEDCITEKEIEELKDNLLHIDSKIIRNNSLWEEAIEDLDEQ